MIAASKIGIGRRGRSALLLGLLASAATLLAPIPPSASASEDCFHDPGQPGFGVAPGCFDAQTTADAVGDTFTQAAGHPYGVTVTFLPNTITHPVFGAGWPVAPLKDVTVETPPGLVGNPTIVPPCSLGDLSSSPILCPDASQVGIAHVHDATGNPSNPTGEQVAAVYAMDSPPGAAARFGFNVSGTVVMTDAEVRRDDYGITFHSTETSEGVAINGVSVTFWGVPGDPSHGTSEACSGGKAKSCSPPPFLRTPTSCPAVGQGLDWGLRTDSWFAPSEVNEASFVSHRAPGLAPAGEPFPASPLPPAHWGAPQGPTDCEVVPVRAEFAAQPTAHDAETSSGLEVSIDVPNPGLENPAGIASSDIKDVKVTLPEGVTINPSQAEGLGVCTPAQYASTELSFHPDPSKGCPSDSKIGTVVVQTPLLKETLQGDVYIAAPHENPFDSLLALYVVIKNVDRGILITLPGKVEPDPRTGQIITTFNDLPQQPFSHFLFKFREGARAPLVTPAACGTYNTEARFTPYSDPNRTIVKTASFQITSGIGAGPCPSGGLPPFHPGLIAGSRNNNAGSYSPFDLRLFRTDSEQEITHFSIKLPPGVIGKLAGLGYCPEASIEAAKAKSGGEELASPSCPASSEVGRTLVGAGVGSVLAYAPGRIYLAGPYHGSPLSIAAITAAKVGPFDLGTVVVRQALRIDPETAAVFIDATGSDPIPHIIDGITVHLRDIRAYVDRPDFTLNPTSCDPTSTASTVLGSGLDFASPADDLPVTVATRYQAANCANLPFRPKLSLSLRGQTRRAGNPAFRAQLTMKPGEANIASAQVTLPSSAFIDNSHIGTVCTRVQFNQGAVPGEACPPASVYGYARAITPLLDTPIEGPVYLRSNPEHTLPDLLAALHSGQINIALAGHIDSFAEGRIRNTFEVVPDAPVSKFVLSLKGGRKGLIENSRNLCATRNRALVHFVGHNGKVDDYKTAVRPGGCGGKKGKRHQRSGR